MQIAALIVMLFLLSAGSSINSQETELNKPVRITIPSQSTNMALYFDGSDEVIVPSDASLNPTSGLTVMAWIRADDWNGNRRIVQKGVDDQYRLIDEGSLEFGLSGVTDGDIATPLPSTEVWHHVVGTYDGSSIKLYVDSILKISQSASGSLATSSTSLYIGNKPLSSYSGDFFKGSIDEVRIYNRALTIQEINNTMTNASPTSDGLVLYFSFETLLGSTCTDLSGYGNDGTINGAIQIESFNWTSVGENLPPTAPHFLNPPDSINTSTCLIFWNESIDSDGSVLNYELQIDTSIQFDNPTTYTTPLREYELEELMNGTYYLRVRAVDDFGSYSSWSQAHTFVVSIPKVKSDTSQNEILVWGDADPNGEGRAGRIIAENLRENGFNVTFVSAFSELETELTSYQYSVLVLVAMPWSDSYSDIPSATENTIESQVLEGSLGMIGFHDIIWHSADNPVLEELFGGTLYEFQDRDSTYTIVNESHPVAFGLPTSFNLDDDQLLYGSWDLQTQVIARADWIDARVVVSNTHGVGRCVYIAAGGGSGYSNAVASNDTNLVNLYTNAVSWVGYYSEDVIPVDPEPLVLPNITVTQHPSVYTQDDVTISWLPIVGFDEYLIEYEFAMSSNLEIQDSTRHFTNETTFTINVNVEGWYYYWIRAWGNRTIIGEWSDAESILVLLTTPIIHSPNDITMYDTETDVLVFWEVSTDFPFDYSVSLDGILFASGENHFENVTITLQNVTAGLHTLRLEIVDLAGREFYDTITVNSIQDTSMTTVIGGSIAFTALFFAISGVVLFQRRTRSRWQNKVKEQLAMFEQISLEALSFEIGTPEDVIQQFVTESRIGLVTVDSDTLISTKRIQQEVLSILDSKGVLNLGEFAQKWNLSLVEVQDITMPLNNAYQKVGGVIIDKNKLVKIIRDRFLTEDRVHIKQIGEDIGIDVMVMRELIESGAVDVYEIEKGLYISLERIIRDLTNEAIREGFVVANYFAKKKGVPLDSIQRLLIRLRHESVIYHPSTTVLLSVNFLENLKRSSLKGTLDKTKLSEKMGVSIETVRKLLKGLITESPIIDREEGKSARHDRQYHRTESQFEQPDRMRPEESWKKCDDTPSLGAAPPSGVRSSSRPVASTGEEDDNSSACCVLQCVFLIITIPLLFIGSIIAVPIIIIGVTLSYIGRIMMGRQTTKKKYVKPSSAVVGPKRGVLGHVCPFCYAISKYHEREINDQGAVYCKDCGSVFILEKDS